MTRLTVTAKGRVTSKQDLLKHLGVNSGEQLEATKLPLGRIIVRAAGQDGSIVDFIGCLSQRGRRELTIEEMNKIVTDRWVKEDHR